MKKTYIKPELKTLHLSPQNIIASSFISPELPPDPGEDEEDDERVDATANQTIWEDFGGINGYEQQWYSRYDW